MRHVVIASIPRTASTLLCELLAQHPAILGCGELFCDEEDGRRYYHRAALEDARWYRGHEPFHAYLDYLTAAARLLGREVCSWKLMDSQEPQAWRFVADTPSVPLLHTHRQNALESCTSALISHACGAWHARGGDDRVKAATVRVQVTRAELEHWHARNRGLVARLDALPNPILRLQYEDFTTRYAETAARVFEFLGLPPVEVRPTQMKLNPRSLRERISNYDELRAQCAGTVLDSYFEA